jgi:hypothetical protein
MLVLMRQALGLIATSFSYDGKGRVIERRMAMGGLAERRYLFRYDEYDNPVSQTSEERSREVGYADDGSVQMPNDQTHWSETQFTYVYDARGNWIERIVSSRQRPDAPVTRSSIERRTIEYY